MVIIRGPLVVLAFHLLGAAALMTCPLSLCADPPSPEVKKQVAELVRELQSPNAAKAAAAATALLKLGPDILPLLPEPEAKLTEDQKKQLEDVRKALVEARTRKELSPRRCTIRNSAIPLADALTELTKQTGIQVAAHVEGKQAESALKLDLAGVTFWQALDAIAKEADLRVAFFQKDSLIALVDGPSKEVPISYDGIFRTTVSRLELMQDYRTEAHYLVVHLEIAWEPRFQPLFFEAPPDELVARDDKDNALSIPDSGKGRAPVGRPVAVDVPIRIEAPRRSVEKIGLLKGAFSVVGPSRLLTFTFDNLAPSGKPGGGQKQTQEGVTVTLREFRADSEPWTVGVVLDYPPETPDFESFESWLVNNDIHMEKKGSNIKAPANGGYEIDDQSGHRAVLTYRFIEDDKVTLGKPSDWKLVYRTAGSIAKLPVHFEFKSLPLP
jgi:hypothetical protein